MEKETEPARDIKSQLRSLPRQTGVYLLKDSGGVVIYVGKALDIRSRVSSHFNPRGKQPRGLAMMGSVHHIEYMLTDSEVEALILENNLINRHQPRYNIMLKDDKSFPWVKVTVKDDYPSVTVTRGLVDDGSRYFGPYINVDAINRTMKYLRRLFPVRKCRIKIGGREKKKIKPCLDYHIRRCFAPCVETVDRNAYNSAVASICLFLDGKQDALIAKLRSDMSMASGREEYERAAELRDIVRSLEKTVGSRQKVYSPNLKSYDVIACASENGMACVQVFFMRRGKLLGQEHHLLKNDGESDARSIIGAFVKQFYDSNREIPGEIHLQANIEDRKTVEKWLSQKSGVPVVLRVPRRKDIIKMAERNALFHLRQGIPEDGRKTLEGQARMRELKEILCLEKMPARIEAFDISLGGNRDAVGSMVTFENGLPKKNGYRRFKIKTVAGQDDFAMLREVALRRYKRVIAENAELPDLILVDGGKGQLSAVLEGARVAGAGNVPVVSLAKQFEEIYVPGKDMLLSLPRDSKALKLLQYARDEAHRFAVGYHRKLRGRTMRKSGLSEIPGIGVKRTKAMLVHFGSLDKIKKATVEDLSEVQGMTRTSAEAVVRWARKNT